MSHDQPIGKDQEKDKISTVDAFKEQKPEETIELPAYKIRTYIVGRGAFTRV